MKTFKSNYLGQSHQELNIVRLDDGLRVSVDHGSHGAMGIVIAPSDAPALALAILEAAGYKEEQGNETTEAAHRFGMAMLHLRLGIKEQDYITAESKAQAELEAEALELYKTYWSGNVTGFSNELNRDDWINVARRAREMRAEK